MDALWKTGLINHYQGKHLFLHPQSFSSPTSITEFSTLTLLAVFLFSTWSENKNVFMLGFLSLLVELDIFQEVKPELLARWTHSRRH